LDFSNPQVTQNLLLLVLLIFGIISIFLNWRTAIPAAKSEFPSLNREQDEAWQQLFRQSERERLREQAEYERDNKELVAKLAARTSEVETLRALIDRLTSSQRAEALNLNISNRHGGVDVSGGTVATGQDMVGGDKKVT
jgi:hypothetical protein